MADVFISYKSEQRDQACRVAELLRASGYHVWWDRELLGENFQRKIDEELNGAACAVVLWSKAALGPNSDYVRAEATMAFSKKKLVCANLEAINLPVPFNTQNYISFIDWNGDESADCAQKLLRVVARFTHRAYRAPESLRKKWAVLVATSVYKNDSVFPSLPDTGKVTEALVSALSSAEGSPFVCNVLFDKERIEVLRALKEVAEKAASNELILLYFRCHAHWTQSDGLCLCLANSNPDDLVASSVPLRLVIQDILGKASSEQVAILLDCAFSVATDDVTESTVSEFSVADVIKQDLAANKGKSMVFLTATIAGDGNSSGAFTEALADSLNSWSADKDGDGIVMLDEWFDFAKAAANLRGERAVKWLIGSAGNIEIARRAPKEQVAPELREVIPPALLDCIENALAEERAIIPLLGNGIFETGPLSCHHLVDELRKLSSVLGKASADLSLPEASEYLIQTRYKRNREAFLTTFRKILEAKQRESNDLAIHNFVLKHLEAPWLIVSTTYDWALEHRLEQAQRSFLVVSHLLRSEGDVLILHCNPAPDRVEELEERGVPFASDPDKKWVVYRSRADNFLPKEAEDCIIYKVLGSPFLNQRAEGLQTLPPFDTVVIAETDHTILLGRLERKSANVPTAFADPFRLRHLLFLGYSLDLWHYRLFGNLFRRAVAEERTCDVNQNNPIAVVRPQTPDVEIEFWKALGAENYLCRVDALALALMARKQEVASGI